MAERYPYGLLTMLIDVGNSRVKWLGGGEAAVQSVATDHWQQALALWQRMPKAPVYVSSVKSQAWTHRFVQGLSQALGVPVYAVEPMTRFQGLSLVYQPVASLGVDRWLAMVAAIALKPKTPLVIITAGSAVTVDYLDSGGEHRGGLIAPGVRMQLSALNRKTDRLGLQPANLPKELKPGTATLECIQNGVGAMVSGFIRSAIHLLDESHALRTVLLSGGDAELISQYCPSDSVMTIEPNLVILGLSVYRDWHQNNNIKMSD